MFRRYIMKRQNQWATKYGFTTIASCEDRAIYVHPVQKYVVVITKTKTHSVYYSGEVVWLDGAFKFGFRTQGFFKSLLKSIKDNKVGTWYFEHKQFVSAYEKEVNNV